MGVWCCLRTISQCNSTFLLCISPQFFAYSFWPTDIFLCTFFALGTAVAQWLRCCVTNRKVAGSIPAGVNGFFIDIKSFRSHYGPGVDSASNRNEYQDYFLGVKVRKADNLPPSCAVVTKSWSLNFLEPSGPVQACNGTALPLLFFTFFTLRDSNFYNKIVCQNTVFLRSTLQPDFLVAQTPAVENFCMYFMVHQAPTNYQFLPYSLGARQYSQHSDQATSWMTAKSWIDTRHG